MPKRKGRVRLQLFIRPVIIERLKAQAEAETAANGGPVQFGGHGVVTVSDIVERVVIRMMAVERREAQRRSKLLQQQPLSESEQIGVGSVEVVESLPV